MIKAERIGHVVLKVRDVQRSRAFYTEVLGMDVMMEIPAIPAVFLANNRRDHHEIALFEVGAEAEGLHAKQIGLAHVAFRLRNEKELRAAYEEFKEKHVPRSPSPLTTASRRAFIFATPTGTSSKYIATIRPKTLPSSPTRIWG
jgi:catechol-2,3-dioxygenase